MPAAAPTMTPTTSRTTWRMNPSDSRAREHKRFAGPRSRSARMLPFRGSGVSRSKDQTSQTDRHTIGEPTQQEVAAFKPRLIVVSGILLGQQLELGAAPIIIGRAS